MMRVVRWTVLLGALLVLLPVMLTGCSGDVIRDAYTASGDEVDPDELRKTTVFRYDDDLNVVVTLNAHTYNVPLQAIFRSPDGRGYPTDVLEASETVGVVLLGLDWEAQGQVPWAAGDWQVEILVEEDRQRTLSFTVQPQPQEFTPETELLPEENFAPGESGGDSGGESGGDSGAESGGDAEG